MPRFEVKWYKTVRMGTIVEAVDEDDAIEYVRGAGLEGDEYWTDEEDFEAYLCSESERRVNDDADLPD